MQRLDLKMYRNTPNEEFLSYGILLITGSKDGLHFAKELIRNKYLILLIGTRSNKSQLMHIKEQLEEYYHKENPLSTINVSEKIQIKTFRFEELKLIAEMERIIEKKIIPMVTGKKISIFITTNNTLTSGNCRSDLYPALTMMLYMPLLMKIIAKKMILSRGKSLILGINEQSMTKTKHLLEDHLILSFYKTLHKRMHMEYEKKIDITIVNSTLSWIQRSEKIK